MKILLCLNRDIYCTLALNYLLKTLQNHQVKIYFSNGVGGKPINKHLQLLQACEYDLSIKNIKSIVQKSAINVDWNNFYDFEKIQQNYLILNFQNINQDGLKCLSKDWQPDLIISIRFGQIFKEPIISLPKFGIINLHSGILPDYRGIMATFWSMLSNEQEIGTTLHYINDSSIDTGNIITISRNKTNYQTSFLANVLELYESGTKSIEKHINALQQNLKIKITKQERGVGKYFSYPSDQDINNFLNQNKLI